MRRSGLFWGIVLVLIGLLLLLSNLDVIDLDLWSAIWAVLLIALGLGVLWGVLVGSSAPEGEELSIPLGSAITARLRLRHGAGRLRVGGGAEEGHLVQGSFSGAVNYRTQRDGDELSVEMWPRGFPYVLVPWNWGRHGAGWSFRLNDEVPLSLGLETGASEARLDLSELRVTDLRLQTGASSVDVTLPARAGDTRVRIEAGAASVSLRVPSGVAARIRFQGALASVEVDRNRFPRRGRAYVSPDFETAQNRADIEIEAGVGSLRVT